MSADLKNWLELRIGMNELRRRYIDENRVPASIRIFSTLGLVTAAGFLLQFVTGMIMLLYYVPHPDHAFASVREIMTSVPFGWLIREMHAVGGNVLVATMLLHMLSVFFMGNYKRPRELTWVSGGLMLILLILSGLTGVLLPWTQFGYWTTTMVTAMPAAFPVAGKFVTTLFRGSEHVSGDTLGRFFALHVAMLPFLLLLLGGIHVFLIQRLGISATPFGISDEESRQWTAYHKKKHPHGIPYYPSFFLKQVFMILLYLAVVFLFLAVSDKILFSPETYAVADPLKTPENIRPVWYMRAPYQLLKLIPNKFLGISLELLLVAVFLFWPFLDTQREKNLFKRPVLRGVFVVLFCLWIVLLFWGKY